MKRKDPLIVLLDGGMVNVFMLDDSPEYFLYDNEPEETTPAEVFPRTETAYFKERLSGESMVISNGTAENETVVIVKKSVETGEDVLEFKSTSTLRIRIDEENEKLIIERQDG